MLSNRGQSLLFIVFMNIIDQGNSQNTHVMLHQSSQLYVNQSNNENKGFVSGEKGKLFYLCYLRVGIFKHDKSNLKTKT